jgi:LysR family transcriptional regulator, benzoate and cis,cis-muconate-responsive activator of ben and cat genes
VELELRHLRYLVVLGEELNFTRAAARLGIAQSALSSQVRRLERHLDVPLFTRSPRSVRLTPEGTELVARARSLLGNARRIEDDVRTRAAQSDLPAALRVTAETIPPEMLGQLARRYPGTSVTVRYGAAEQGAAALTRNETDLVHGWDLPSEPLRMRPGTGQATLVDEPLWAVLPADHPLSDAGQISVAQLRGEAWVSAGPRTRRARHLLATCRSAGFTPEIRYVADDPSMIHDLLLSGCCVALAPPRQLPEGCRAVRLVEDVRARLFYAWRTDAVPPWLAREILETSRMSFLGRLGRRDAGYRRLVDEDPVRFATLTDDEPEGWPLRRGTDADGRLWRGQMHRDFFDEGPQTPGALLAPDVRLPRHLPVIWPSAAEVSVISRRA